MLVVVGSQNPVKVEAVRQACSLYFDVEEVVGVKVSSGVKPVPTSEAETLQGALTRAQESAVAAANAEFAVGIEAGVITVNDHHLALAFAAVLRGDQLGLGSSAGFELPTDLLAELDPTSDAFKQMIDRRLGGHNLFQTTGSIGVLTQGQLTRTDILRDAVVCALVRFVSPQYY
ncbi:MAG: inosine/xanthosine triphosphatase [Promethearchaeota archaeon]